MNRLILFSVLGVFLPTLTLADVSYSLLGNVVDHGQIWSYSGDALFHEIFGWNVSVTPVSGTVEVTACLHIRSGDGVGHSRLYNKFRVIRLSPIRDELLGVDSEALVEHRAGDGDLLRFFDASRCWNVRDMNPVLGQLNVYGVEVIAGDGLHVEVSYGSTLSLRQ